MERELCCLCYYLLLTLLLAASVFLNQKNGPSMACTLSYHYY